MGNVVSILFNVCNLSDVCVHRCTADVHVRWWSSYDASRSSSAAAAAADAGATTRLLCWRWCYRCHATIVCGCWRCNSTSEDLKAPCRVHSSLIFTTGWCTGLLCLLCAYHVSHFCSYADGEHCVIAVIVLYFVVIFTTDAYRGYLCS